MGQDELVHLSSFVVSGSQSPVDGFFEFNQSQDSTAIRMNCWELLDRNHSSFAWSAPLKRLAESRY